MSEEELIETLKEFEKNRIEQLKEPSRNLFYAIMKIADERDKYKIVIDKIKEYIEENKYKKMGGYGDNEDEDIEVCLFEDDIWKLEELLEEIE